MRCLSLSKLWLWKGTVMMNDLPLEEAVGLMRQYCECIEETEEVNLLDADGRILGEDILAPLPQPIFSRSAVDGYALRCEDTLRANRKQPITLEVIDTVYAGGCSEKCLHAGQAIQIMTGARIPQGANAVIRLEDTNDDLQDLRIYKEVKQQENICFEGEDFHRGDLLLKKGDRLDFARLAIASSVGMENIPVLRKLRIALCISGDEVTPLGQPLTPGRIYDSNYALLYHRLKCLGYPPIAASYVQDDPHLCAKTLHEYATQADLIITTGGVSVGKKDILHEALTLAGAKKVFWKVQVKPGTPAMFSMIGKTPVLSLSGNPFAASATFELLAAPLLAYMQQDAHIAPVIRQAILQTPYLKNSEKRRMVRAFYQAGKVMIPEGLHSSGALSTLVDCNCLLDIPAHTKQCQYNEAVQVWLLGGYYE